MPRRASRPAPRRPRWQRRPDARPEEILEAALAVFGEQGFARTRLDDVARRAGVSRGTLYLYFDSKEALFQALIQAKVEGTMAVAEETVRTWTGSSTDLLRHFIHRYWETMTKTQHCRLARLIISELSNFPDLARFHYRTVVLRVRKVIETILIRGVTSGEFTVHDPTAAARMLQTLCVHLAQYLAYFQPHDTVQTTGEDMLANIIDLYFHGVLARPAAGGTA